MKDGEPLFVAADVCGVLEIQNVTDALKGLDEDEKMTLATTEGRNGGGLLLVISEAGLYSLVLRSRKPEARTFNFGGAPVRVVMKDEEPWFVAADVCGVLELGTGNIARDIDEDEQGFINLMTPGGMQQMLAITESGLYSLVLRSRKQEAKPFNFGGAPVRVVMKDEEPWFVAKDVCDVLDITWSGSKTLAVISDRHKGVVKFTTPGGECFPHVRGREEWKGVKRINTPVLPRVRGGEWG